MIEVGVTGVPPSQVSRAFVPGAPRRVPRRPPLRTGRGPSGKVSEYLVPMLVDAWPVRVEVG
jgi:hypothetical protein